MVFNYSPLYIYMLISQSYFLRMNSFWAKILGLISLTSQWGEHKLGSRNFLNSPLILSTFNVTYTATSRFTTLHTYHSSEPTYRIICVMWYPLPVTTSQLGLQPAPAVERAQSKNSSSLTRIYYFTEITHLCHGHILFLNYVLQLVSIQILFCICYILWIEFLHTSNYHRC